MIFGDDGYSSCDYDDAYERGIKFACAEKDKELLMYETKYKEVISIIIKDRDKYKEALEEITTYDGSINSEYYHIIKIARQALK